MPAYSHNDAEYATHIVERLINREARSLDLEQDLVVSDVEADTESFSSDLALLADFDLNVPAVKIADETVPVSLEIAVGQSTFPPFRLGDQIWRHPFFREAVYYYLRPMLRERKFEGFTSMNREEARITFVKRATEFLATRIAAVKGFRSNETRQEWHRPVFLNLRQMRAGKHVATPGCHFTVSTNSSGLRVFWSGAYYVTPNNFNHPTTPTSSVLQSGTYIFGVDGGAYGNQINWDFNLVVSLPGLPYAHLNF